MGIESVQNSPHFASAQSLQQGSQQVSGSLAGMSVTLTDDPVSALNDSAEELTFARDNSKQTKLADRKQKTRSSQIEEQLKKIKQAQKSIQNADNEALKRVLKQWKGNSLPQLLQLLSQTGAHSSSVYAFLLNEADAAAEQGDPALQETLTKAAEQLFAEHKAGITAVLNTLDAMPGGDDSAFAPLQLSQAYSDISSSAPTAESVLAYLQKKFGAERLDEGIDYMFTALAADLAADKPSQADTVLENVASALTRTRTLNAALHLSDHFVERLHSALHLKTAPDFTGGKLLADLLKLSGQRFVAGLHIQNLYARQVHTRNPEDEVLVAQEFLQYMRDMPEDLFAGAQDRSKMLEATQKLVDGLIDKEDEWLESGGA